MEEVEGQHSKDQSKFISLSMDLRIYLGFTGPKSFAGSVQIGALHPEKEPCICLTDWHFVFSRSVMKTN